MSSSDNFTRRSLLKALAVTPTISGILGAGGARAQAGPATPLTSWNDGPAKQAILEFD